MILIGLLQTNHHLSLTNTEAATLLNNQTEACLEMMKMLLETVWSTSSQDSGVMSATLLINFIKLSVKVVSQFNDDISNSSKYEDVTYEHD